MIETLQAKFALPGAVTVGAGTNGLPKVILTHRSGARAEAYLHGGHITSWQLPAGDEQFFLSQASHYAEHKAIRGGIPVIFPQFGGGPLPTHGFARINEWTLVSSAVQEDGTVAVGLRLTPTAEIMAVWPYQFQLDLQMLLAATSLTVRLQVANHGDQPFPFQAVLHTYFAVTDIARTTVHGLAGVTYIDSLREGRQDVETRAAIPIAEETDRIYLSAPDTLRVGDEKRTVTIEKTQLPDVVVWNPWSAKAQRMADFGDDEYQRMVCVETGRIADPGVLAPGETWAGETVFRA